MSSLLEESIIDANTLKEIAIKNAEQAIVEKYAHQIKEAVESLLEQDDEEMVDDEMGLEGGGGEEGLDMGGGLNVEVGGESDIAKDLPLAATNGEKLCGCPDDEEEIEVDFDDLEKQLSGDEMGVGMGGEEESHEDLANDLEDKQLNALEEEVEMTSDNPEEMDSTEEEYEINEEDLSAILEELTVDLDVGSPNGKVIGGTEKDKEENLENALALTQDTKVKEEMEELKKTVKDLQESVGNLNKKLVTKEKYLEKTIKENKQYKELLTKFKDKLNEVNLKNAQLFYTNRVLENASLNERQKQKLVESISKSQTVESTKVAYEMLQEVVSGKDLEKELSMKALNEAISKPSSFVLSSVRRNTEDNKTTDPSVDRLMKLAGIKKNN